MKCCVAFALLLVAVVATIVSANQVAEEEQSQAQEVPIPEGGAEEFGFTCIMGDWACSAHCRGIGKKGGTCEKGTCTCYN